MEAGSRLVQEAGTTMQDIVQSVQRVNDMIGEITAASTEQSAGVAQVNQAVGNLDQMTQQNAAGACASSPGTRCASACQAIGAAHTGRQGTAGAAGCCGAGQEACRTAARRRTTGQSRRGR